MLHLVAEGDGGEIALEDFRDLGVLLVFVIRERDAQLEAGLFRHLLQGVLVIVHDLGLGRVRGHGRVRFLRGDGGRFVLAAGGSRGARQGGEQDEGPYLFHSHHSFPTLQN